MIGRSCKLRIFGLCLQPFQGQMWTVHLLYGCTLLKTWVHSKNTRFSPSRSSDSHKETINRCMGWSRTVDRMSVYARGVGSVAEWS